MLFKVFSLSIADTDNTYFDEKTFEKCVTSILRYYNYSFLKCDLQFYINGLCNFFYIFRSPHLISLCYVYHFY